MKWAYRFYESGNSIIGQIFDTRAKIDDKNTKMNRGDEIFTVKANARYQINSAKSIVRIVDMKYAFVYRVLDWW